MLENNIDLLSNLFTDLAANKRYYIAKQINYNSNLIENLVSQYTKYINEKLSLFQSIITEYSIISDEIKTRNKSSSILYNPLKFFYIGETTHSVLLASLLDPNSDHGQGDLFLKSFLKRLNIEVNPQDKWIVTAETGRIDILIKRLYPHTVVIIENKSNLAKDQDNQLYRYWYQEVYLPNLNRVNENAITASSNSDNYKVIYLSPSKWKSPLEHSLARPINYDTSLPDRMPIEPTIWYFNYQIKNWLQEDVITNLHNDNYRMRAYLNFYLELFN